MRPSSIREPLSIIIYSSIIPLEFVLSISTSYSLNSYRTSAFTSLYIVYNSVRVFPTLLIDSI
jgi:hypothetical protein